MFNAMKWQGLVKNNILSQLIDPSVIDEIDHRSSVISTTSSSVISTTSVIDDREHTMARNYYSSRYRTNRLRVKLCVFQCSWESNIVTNVV